MNLYESIKVNKIDKKKLNEAKYRELIPKAEQYGITDYLQMLYGEKPQSEYDKLWLSYMDKHDAIRDALGKYREAEKYLEKLGCTQDEINEVGKVLYKLIQKKDMELSELRNKAENIPEEDRGPLYQEFLEIDKANKEENAKKYPNSVNVYKEAENILSDDIKVYMNTWKNYNDYGADLEAYGIKDGWMTPEEALEFCKKYAEDEPFINDTDNCPIEVSEYDNPVDKLNELIRYDEYEDKELLKNAMETGQYSTVDEYIDVLDSGDYIWLPGVNDDESLARAYIDMVGGLDGISNKEDYFDKESWKDDVRADEEDNYRENYLNGEEFDEDEFESYLDGLADEMAENYDGSDESVFDYEAFGDDLSSDYTFTSDGAINLF